ncbi:MAG: maltose alpha-D-glucosyltransferase [Planctomycetes bacterium]|nr:maltose alpha-D-glucosyltransferase [Planctomycetota bacterium]
MGPPARKEHPVREDPLWYKDALIYELHVRSFHDADGDGIGDFAGLTAKLDYLVELGVTALWLLPFYPSPLRDDGYDIADYQGVHPAYGSVADVRRFLREAHRRGLRVITELVLNHTSEQHPWFQRARRAPPGHPHREFYVWRATPDGYRDARIIFKDFESSNWSWDAVAGAYYWHRFYAHQPDLNFDRPEVRRALRQVVDFWLGMGVDGLRLDAVPYLFEREGTNCENLPETHAFLRELRRHVDRRFARRMLLAEANQWPEEAAAYLGVGDECHMAFHFPIMPRMFMAIHLEDRFPILDILQQTPALPASCQWAIFLRNHDELTLEMVTDEERDYMYRVYAHDPQARINLGIRRRLAPLLGNNRRKIELMNSLLLSLPGTPVIYYGDEIGMGDNIYLGDRNGVRTPMQWSADRNAGFSRANPQRLFLPIGIDPEYHYEAVNVDAQAANPHSLLSWMKRILALRRHFRAFGRGAIEFLQPANRKVLAFVRRYEEEAVLVVANLARHVQFVELELSAYRGMTPIELFGRQKFPVVGTKPYFLTLGPHGFYWFQLVRAREEAAPGRSPAAAPPVSLEVEADWEEVFAGGGRCLLDEALPGWLSGRRWLSGRGRQIKVAAVAEQVRWPLAHGAAWLAFVRVEYTDGTPETYLVPVAFAGGAQAVRLVKRAPEACLASLRVRGGTSAGGRGRGRRGREGVLYDALENPEFRASLLGAFAPRRTFRGRSGEVTACVTPFFRKGGAGPARPPVAGPDPLRHANTMLLYDERWALKVYRRLDEGVNPDLELARFLTEKVYFRHTPDVGGYLEYGRRGRDPMTLAVLQTFVPNHGDAWSYFLELAEDCLDRVPAGRGAEARAPGPAVTELDVLEETPPDWVREHLAAPLEAARRLGGRTAEMHLALAGAPQDPAFAPEAFTRLWQRSLYQALRSRALEAMNLLAARWSALPAPLRGEAARLIGARERVLRIFRPLLEGRCDARRIRIHGDYHLGQVLHTGKDFTIIDFEGKSSLPLTERRIKRSPMRDVASMLWSFRRVARGALARYAAEAQVRALAPWAELWRRWTGSAFVRAWLEEAGKGGLLPAARADRELLLRVDWLDRGLQELAEELASPSWGAEVSLRGILELLDAVRGPARGGAR